MRDLCDLGDLGRAEYPARRPAINAGFAPDAHERQQKSPQKRGVRSGSDGTRTRDLRRDR
jgi:hypothetical protein